MPAVPFVHVLYYQQHTTYPRGSLTSGVNPIICHGLLQNDGGCMVFHNVLLDTFYR